MAVERRTKDGRTYRTATRQMMRRVVQCLGSLPEKQPATVVAGSLGVSSSTACAGAPLSSAGAYGARALNRSPPRRIWGTPTASVSHETRAASYLFRFRGARVGKGGCARWPGGGEIEARLQGRCAPGVLYALQLAVFPHLPLVVFLAFLRPDRQHLARIDRPQRHQAIAIAELAVGLERTRDSLQRR